MSLIHFIVWKFILIALTSLSVNGTPFDVILILESAKARVYKRIATAKYMARKIALRAASRGLTPSFAALRKWLSGIAEVTPEGSITPTKTLKAWLDQGPAV